MTAQRPDDIDGELIRRYRNASETGPAAPSDAVRSAILTESRRIAALNAGMPQPPVQIQAEPPARSTPAAGARRWIYAAFGTLSAAMLAAFLIVPRFLAGPEQAPTLKQRAEPDGAPQSAEAARPADQPAAPAMIVPEATTKATRAAKLEAASAAGINAKVRATAGAAPWTVSAAVAAGDRASVTALLDQGAAVDGADDQGNRPLLLATVQGRLDLVRLLLERGADPNAADRSGRTPLQEARRRQLNQIEALLVHAGAR